MTAPFDHFPSWATGLGLVAHFGVGALVGLVYFQTLWSNARRLVSGGGVIVLLASAIGRVGLAGAALVLASRDGALALLVTTTGILAARHVVMGRIKVVAQ